MTPKKHIKTFISNGIPEMDVDEVQKNLSILHLIDVRRPDEFNNELGHVPGSSLVTLGPDLDDLMKQLKTSDKIVVFICRSGQRSGTATLAALEQGLKDVYNMTGGMIRWNDFELPVAREGDLS